MVSNAGSRSARIGAVVRRFLIDWNATFCGSPQVHKLSLISSSRKGWVTSAEFGMNLLIWLTIPKKRRTPDTSSGGFHFLDSLYFLWIGMNSRMVNDLSKKFHSIDRKLTPPLCVLELDVIVDRAPPGFCRRLGRRQRGRLLPPGHLRLRTFVFESARGLRRYQMGGDGSNSAQMG